MFREAALDLEKNVPRRLPFVFRNACGDWGASFMKSHSVTSFFSICAIHPSYFLLSFCEQERLARVSKKVSNF